MRRRHLLSLGLLAAAGAARAAEAPPPEPGDETTLPRPMPRWLLQAHNGRPVSAEDFRGRFQLLAFGFVSCPDVCPTTLAEMAQVLQMLGDKAARLQPIFVSVDPERDTLPVLREYTASFDRRILGATGSHQLLQHATAAFKVRYAKVFEPGAAPGVYTMDHTAAMFLLGPDGQLLARFVYGTPARDVARRIERWMDAAEK